MMKILKFLLFFPICFFAENTFDLLWNETIKAYETFGNEKYTIQEEITQINHVLQAAAIAKLAGAPDEIVIALLFHDIGQVIQEENIGHLEILHPDHAEIGAEWLKNKGFPPSVVDFVKNHALAKVILCQIDPIYFEHLSLASQISYVYQKAKYDLDSERITAFINHPLYSHFLAARKCDDMSKLLSLSIQRGNLPNFESYRELAHSVLTRKGEISSHDWIKRVDEWHSQMMESHEAFEAIMLQLRTQDK